eukprot:2790578-Rhodomonas_salina.2
MLEPLCSPTRSAPPPQTAQQQPNDTVGKIREQRGKLGKGQQVKTLLTVNCVVNREKGTVKREGRNACTNTTTSSSTTLYSHVREGAAVCTPKSKTRTSVSSTKWNSSIEFNHLITERCECTTLMGGYRMVVAENVRTFQQSNYKSAMGLAVLHPIKAQPDPAQPSLRIGSTMKLSVRVYALGVVVFSSCVLGDNVLPTLSGEAMVARARNPGVSRGVSASRNLLLRGGGLNDEHHHDMNNRSVYDFDFNEVFESNREWAEHKRSKLRTPAHETRAWNPRAMIH